MKPAWILVSFPDAPAAVTAELAQDTARGLMGRASMPEDHGMLFDMVATRDHAFYMRNVPIPLDMIFISAEHIIVGILTNVPPLDDTLRSVGVASRYVLEVNGDWCRRHGVTVGQRVD